LIFRILLCSKQSYRTGWPLSAYKASHLAWHIARVMSVGQEEEQQSRCNPCQHSHCEQAECKCLAAIKSANTAGWWISSTNHTLVHREEKPLVRNGAGTKFVKMRPKTHIEQILLCVCPRRVLAIAGAVFSSTGSICLHRTGSWINACWIPCWCRCWLC
jgi:hypothetical protein